MAYGTLKIISSKTRSFVWLARAAILVMVAVTGCRESDPEGNPLDPFANRKPSRFVLQLDLHTTPAPQPQPPGRCDVPIHTDILPNDLEPEKNLISVLSRQGEILSTQSTDAEGFAAHNSTTTGSSVLELVSMDKLLQAAFPVDLVSARTFVYGSFSPDRDDLDADGSTRNWVILIDVLADADADMTSDNGKRTRWIFSADKTIELRHIGRGTSVQITQKHNSNTAETLEFSDRDGDFVPDDQDPDQDGDTIPNDKEPNSLSCPGFLHEQLSGPTNKHEHLKCNDCHKTTAYFCDDCHSPLGRNWIESPRPDQLPADHFQRDCEQCHRADQPWSISPGPDGHHHETYPISGVHLKTNCFACHITGNLTGISKDCEGCHLSDSPDQHAQKSCGLCHDAEGWNPPAVDHSFYPLSGGHHGLGCSDCHGAVLEEGRFEKPKPNKQCSTCHDFSQDHIPDDIHGCDLCHIVDGWTPPSAHRGDPPNVVFDYTQWSTRWFPVPHLAARNCRDCHTQLDNSNKAVFFNCTTSLCHGGANESNLNQTHNNGQDMGTDPSTQFHLYFFSATDPNAPDEWPTAHTGCVSVHCHSDGRRPGFEAILKD